MNFLNGLKIIEEIAEVNNSVSAAFEDNGRFPKNKLMILFSVPGR